jgi:hypothetical protein
MAEICPPYPFTLTNGTTADATQVMADFNTVRNAVNTNLAHSGANSDITSLSGLTTPLSVAQGGTGATTAADAATALNAVSRAGDTMTGALTINASPTALYCQFGGVVAQGNSQFNNNVDVYGTLAAHGAISVPNGGAMESVTLTSCVINYCYINNSPLTNCALSGGSAAGTTLQSCAATGGFSVTGGLTVDSINGALTVASGLNVSSGDLTVAAGNAVVSGSLTVEAGGTGINVPNGNIVLGGGISCAGAIDVAINLNVGQDVDIVDSLTVHTDSCNKLTSGAWGGISDIRLKKDISPYTRGLADVLKLNPVSYQYNGRGGTPDDGKTYIGLVANDALPVMPEMVSSRKGRLDPGDQQDTDILTINVSSLIYALTNAVKELAARVAVLEAAAVAQG